MAQNSCFDDEYIFIYFCLSLERKFCDKNRTTLPKSKKSSTLKSVFIESSSFEIKLQNLLMNYFPKKFNLSQTMVQILQNVISAVQIGQTQYSVMTVADSATWRAAIFTTANFFVTRQAVIGPNM